ncbi:unnamed protein product [Leptidea sinapis]|uniref:Uncharacterized protein n=1 Tax=Leptidea sinapis TaxID=189913 RepID=A0A5E4QC34_9NEOP|nr:unnamed protein product [Leptidea sinapis]
MENKELLQFDEEVNPGYELAEKYIHEHDKEIIIRPVEEGINMNIRDINFYKKVCQLEVLINENCELFTQLLSIAAMVKIHEARKIDFILFRDRLIQQLLVKPSSNKDSGVYYERTWYQGFDLKSSPLRVNKKMRHVVCLFTTLSHKVGLPIQLEPFWDIDYQCFKVPFGCLGVITGRSDLHSAIDLFMETPTRLPFALQKIWIEESAAEKFNHLMKWKTNLRKDEIEPEILSCCTEAYCYENKLFLFEYAADHPPETDKYVVFIETYRTVKELFTLYDHRYYGISIWCSDLILSNEIAATLSANLIWINDFNNFSSPKISNTYFNYVSNVKFTVTLERTDEVDEVLKLKNEWMQKSIECRKVLMSDVFKGHDISKQLEIYDVAMNGVVSVNGDRSIMCIEIPTGLIYFDTSCASIDFRLISSIIRGNAVLLALFNPTNEELLIWEKLINIGAPIVKYNGKRIENGEFVVKKEYFMNKVIVTKYGSIFAN